MRNDQTIDCSANAPETFDKDNKHLNWWKLLIGENEKKIV